MIERCITCGREVDPGSPFLKCDNCLARENHNKVNKEVTWTVKCAVCGKVIREFKSPEPKNGKTVSHGCCNDCVIDTHRDNVRRLQRMSAK